MNEAQKSNKNGNFTEKEAFILSIMNAKFVNVAETEEIEL